MEKVTNVEKSGIWLYDNIKEMGFSIIKQNWDYYYEDGYSEGKPSLNEEGLVYYVVFYNLGDTEYLNRSESLFSLDEAIQYLNKKFPPFYWS